MTDDEWDKVVEKFQVVSADLAPNTQGGETMKWQPIETAPKDGTTVLVYEGYYKSGDLIHTAQYSARQWVVLDGMEGDFMLEDPTHWMPLPEPPPEGATS